MLAALAQLALVGVVGAAPQRARVRAAARMGPGTSALASPAAAACVDDAVATARSQHMAEVALGRAAYAPREQDGAAPMEPWRFDDESFASPFAACGLAGVHSTRAPVVSRAECDALIAEASDAITSGLSSSFTFTAASRLGEVHASDLPRARVWLSRALPERFWPLLGSRFGADPARLVVYDCLVVRYSAADGGVRQPVHRDAALYTINVPLSAPSSFEGGGTWFELTREVARLERGHALAHASELRHAGHRLRAGERWVLVLFAIVDDEPELARRLGELAAAARVDGRAHEASAVYERAIALAPADHELHYGQAVARAAVGDERGAREAFARAAALYPHCPRPHAALGTLALTAGETGVALAQFDAARALAADEAENAWWEAAVNGALCAALLAEAAGPASAGEWHSRLRDDAARLHVALSCTPGGDKRLTDLVARVEGLLAR